MRDWFEPVKEPATPGSPRAALVRAEVQEHLDYAVNALASACTVARQLPDGDELYGRIARKRDEINDLT